MVRKAIEDRLAEMQDDVFVVVGKLMALHDMHEKPHPHSCGCMPCKTVMQLNLAMEMLRDCVECPTRVELWPFKDQADDSKKGKGK
jgi:hypothetical protein